MTLQEAASNNWQILLRDKNTGRYFILGDSDNYGYDCYSFFPDKEQDDGYIPFAVDCLPEDEEDRKCELELIEKWGEMTLEEKVDHCLKGMDSSLADCEVLDDEDLLEELWEKC